jgi:hypothetical protein
MESLCIELDHNHYMLLEFVGLEVNETCTQRNK